MTERIHILVDGAEKERFRRRAAREGRSLSDWLRQAALDRLERTEPRTRLDSEADLLEFFDACDALAQDEEPDWEVQRAVIERSKATGAAST